MGHKNIAFIREFLRQEGIPLIASDLGGYRGRTILFHSDTGEVYLRRLPKTLYARPPRPKDASWSVYANRPRRRRA